jgi:hypothetical protein
MKKKPQVFRKQRGSPALQVPLKALERQESFIQHV